MPRNCSHVDSRLGCDEADAAATAFDRAASLPGNDAETIVLERRAAALRSGLA